MLKARTKVLAVAVFAAMAVGAIASASASAAPQWLINGAAFSGTETISSKALGSGFTLRSKLPGGAAVTISCPTLSTEGGRIFGDKENSAKKIAFGPTCAAIAPKCTVQAQITTGEVTSEATDLADLEPLYIKFVPTAQPFSKISLMACSGEGTFEVHGLASCRVLLPTTSAITKLCTFQESKTLLGTLRFGTEPATLEGTAGFTLSGPNTGQPWSANL
jgi:hypothetical protein